MESSAVDVCVFVCLCVCDIRHHIKMIIQKCYHVNSIFFGRAIFVLSCHTNESY